MDTQFKHGYALLIGVGYCQYTPWSLPVTVKDAQALQTALVDPNLCAYPPDHIRLLHDDSATRQGIRDGLVWLQQQCSADAEATGAASATAVVYYSGHGWLEQSRNRYYLIPHDVSPLRPAATALAATEFTVALHDIPAQRLLVFIDSCHAEGMASAKDVDQLELPPNFSKTAVPEAMITQLKQGTGRAIFTSSRGNQKSWVRSDGQLSIYTHHLLEALDGTGCAPGTSTVHVSHLMTHLAQTVPQSAQQQCQAVQTPFFDLASEDFPVALLRGGKGLPAAGWLEASPAVQEAGIRYQAAVSGSGTAVQGQGNQVATGSSIVIGGNVAGSVTRAGDGDAS